MNKGNIESIVDQLARENGQLYPDSYTFNPKGDFTPRAVESIRGLAESYWESRNPEEITRDFNAGVTPADYLKWCQVAIHSVMYTMYFGEDD